MSNVTHIADRGLARRKLYKAAPMEVSSSMFAPIGLSVSSQEVALVLSAPGDSLVAERIAACWNALLELSIEEIRSLDNRRAK